MRFNLWMAASLIVLLSSCIGDDIIDDEVEPQIRISNAPDSIKLGSSYQLEYMYLNNVGEATEPEELAWISSDTSILSIDENGLAAAKSKGSIEVSLRSGQAIDMASISVGQTTFIGNNDKQGSIRTTSTYLLEGSFKVKEEEGNLIIEIAEDYRASTALPGLYLYLTNNPNTTATALEVGPVQVFSGAHSYEIEGVGINDYGYLLYFCKPFNIKVGDGQIQD